MASGHVFISYQLEPRQSLCVWKDKPKTSSLESLLPSPNEIRCRINQIPCYRNLIEDPSETYVLDSAVDPNEPVPMTRLLSDWFDVVDDPSLYSAASDDSDRNVQPVTDDVVVEEEAESWTGLDSIRRQLAQ